VVRDAVLIFDRPTHGQAEPAQTQAEPAREAA